MTPTAFLAAFRRYRALVEAAPCDLLAARIAWEELLAADDGVGVERGEAEAEGLPK